MSGELMTGADQKGGDQHSEVPQTYHPPLTPHNHEPEFTDAEKRELRDMLEADRRVKWFWATTRSIAIWIAAVGGGLIMGWEWVVKLVKNAGGS